MFFRGKIRVLVFGKKLPEPLNGENGPLSVLSLRIAESVSMSAGSPQMHFAWNRDAGHFLIPREGAGKIDVIVLRLGDK